MSLWWQGLRISPEDGNEALQYYEIWMLTSYEKQKAICQHLSFRELHGQLPDNSGGNQPDTGASL